jgi:PKD repeat protein
MPRLFVRLLLAPLLSFILVQSQAQVKAQYTCGDDQLRELLRRVEPAYDNMQLKSNLQLRDYTNKINQDHNPVVENRTTADSAFTIPVVVHIIYPSGQPYGTGTNISYAQVRSQIEALNAAFSKDYPAYNGQSHPAYASDTRIRFCLARNTTDTTRWAQGPGGTEFGVVRYPNTSRAYDHDITGAAADQLLRITHPSTQSFPFDKYLNIWLVSSIGGGNNIMGYAPRPIMPGYLLDGVVMRADIFGDNTTGSSYNLGFGLGQGKILAHEVGHYFNLYHVFQGGCSGLNGAGASTDACDLNGDMICDIEPSTTQNIYCTEGIPNTCTANYATGTTNHDMINDYMSYADDDCMNTFTNDQVQRMWATLKLQRPNLWQPANLALTGVLGTSGCVPPYLNAQINTSDAVFCAGKSITFSNPTAGNTATKYEWWFTGGTPDVSTANTTIVTYTQAGNYKVFLKVNDGAGSRTDSLSFSVLDCKLDSSMLHMSHWYFGEYGALDFTSGTPMPTKVALNNQSIHGESAYADQLPFIGGTVSLSDSLGNLLFYSNGVSVWNSSHKKITTSPMFGASDINASTGMCYIPYPGKKGKYFVAGVYPNFDGTPSGVKFVLVDVNTNTVEPYKEFSHPSLPNRFSQFLTVVPHCNGTDYWIIVKGFGLPDPRFYSFLVTADGIDASQQPVISNGFFHPGFGGAGDQLKANREGNKLVLASPHGFIGINTGALYDFDNSTGLAYNERPINNLPDYSDIQTGVAFSPNGKYFYLFRSTNFATNGPPYWLFQYRVSDMQYNVVSAPGFYFAASVQPGPDNQVYVTTQENMVARISNPDNWGTFSFNGSFINMRQLDDRIRPNVSIPNFIDARQPTPAKPDFSTTAVNCNTFRFSSLCFTNYTATWNFGDGSPAQTGNTVQHNYTTAGKFNVKLTLSRGATVYGNTTKIVDVLPLSARISGPGSVCTNSNRLSQYFSPVLSDVNYRWTVAGGKISGPDNLAFVDVDWSPTNNQGTIELQITRQGCSFNDSKIVAISKGPAFNWSLPDSVCVFDSAFLLAAGPMGGKFTGPGVTDNVFSPSKAGAGNHMLTYTYFDEITCEGRIEKTMKVRKCNIPTDQNTDCDEVLNTVQVAPNPVDDVLRLRSPYVLKFVQVFNSAGQKITEGQLINNSIRLPLIASGLYTALVYCDKTMEYRVVRFLKGR